MMMMVVVGQQLFGLLTVSCLLQGPPGSKGERGERVSQETLDHLLVSGLSPGPTELI